MKALAVRAVALLAAACAEELPLEEMPSAFAEVACRKSFECCTTSEIPEDRSEESCRINTTTFLSLAVPQITKSQDKDRVRYDAERAAECKNGLADLSCDGWRA